MSSDAEIGYGFPNGCRITHGTGAQIKKPFADIDVTMHNFTMKSAKSFSGQLGFIEFNTDIRLPRHIHMDAQRQSLIDERIIVLHGVGLVELEGKYFVIAPGSLADIPGGVPHTWTACPPGIRLPDGSISTGKFTMVYEYEDTTTFFPTNSVKTITSVDQYRDYEGSLEDIRIPKLSVEDVTHQAMLVFNRDLLEPSLA